MVITRTANESNLVLNIPNYNGDPVAQTSFTVNIIIPYRWHQECDTLMNRPFKVKRGEDASEKTDWRRLLNFNEEYEEYWQETVTMLCNYQPIYGVHVAHAHVEKI